MANQKVLIIKTGYSETLDHERDSRRTSLGDVLRTTTLLHVFKDDVVTWMTDEMAFPLLEGNKLIRQLLPFDLAAVLQLQAEEFDAVVNLEKVPGICALADSIKAWRKYGFRFHSATGTAEAYDRAFEVLAVSSSPNAKKENKRTVQELLFEMVGAHWQEEGYILGYQSQTREEWDVGLNSQVGQKWPTKMWPHEYWKQLEKLLGERGLRVSRQDNQPKEVLSDLYKYMDWIHSCRTIVSNDSLGMHLGIAMQKKVFGLFGPTPDKEVYFYGRGKAILPEKLPDCAPCFKNQCARELLPCCMDLISPDGVANEVLREYSH